MRINRLRILALQILSAVLAVGLASPPSNQSAAPPQKGYSSPQEAVEMLLKAAEQNDATALAEIFGPDGTDLITSGDSVQDRNYRAAFVSKAQEKKAVVVDPQNRGRAVVSVGNDDWPFPLPIVKRAGKWFFDAKTGRDEILFRRIGANELNAIQVCRGFVEAQQEYADLAQEITGTAQYAQRIFSSPGKRDGLYWQNADGSPGGPISEAIARVIAEGYSASAPSGYHGYYFSVLKGQGPEAPLGEMDYVIEGIMIGGFALIAVPVEYRVSGVKTFLVSHDGIVYQKDLGPESLSIARKIERYNPDKTWLITDDQWPPETRE